MQYYINEWLDDWDMQADWTNGSGHVCQRVTDKYTVSKLIKKRPGTLGACSAFSFLTSSPCWATRACGQEEESACVLGGAGAEVGGDMPGL